MRSVEDIIIKELEPKAAEALQDIISCIRTTTLPHEETMRFFGEEFDKLPFEQQVAMEHVLQMELYARQTKKEECD